MEPWATADQVWQGALIFGRIGAVMLMLPGVGESYVPPRIRLSLALLISLVLWPVVAGALPALPSTLGGMAGWIIREVLVGLAIGAILRAFMTALSTAGETVSLQTALSFAQTANPLQAQPGTTLSAFLMLLGTTLIFATNTHHLFVAGLVGSYELIAPARPLVTGDFVSLAVDTVNDAFLLGTTLIFATNTHHLFIAGLVGSYDLIAPARPLIAGDFVSLAVGTVNDAFLLGIQLAAPVLVFGLIFNLASGLVARVMPQFQVFFAAAPLSIILGLSVFALSLGVVGTVFIDRYRAVANVFVGGAGG